MKKYKIAFICVHNSCRSQIAEALCKYYASDILESYSAGTALKDEINKDAVRLMKELYSIDMTVNQYSKLLEDIPDVDIVITMGCNVVCPKVEAKYYKDLGLKDPTNLGDIEFLKVIKDIEKFILELKANIITYSNLLI